jgi:excisionase family DNA binding protein
MGSSMIERYLSVTEIAEQLRISRRTIVREITAGRLVAVRMTARGDLRVSEEALRAWLDHRSPAA